MTHGWDCARQDAKLKPPWMGLRRVPAVCHSISRRPPNEAT